MAVVMAWVVAVAMAVAVAVAGTVTVTMLPIFLIIGNLISGFLRLVSNSY